MPINAHTVARYGLLLLTAVLGLFLLFLSFPRLHAEVRFLPVETALRNHDGIRPIVLSRFPGLIETAEKAIVACDDSRYQFGLGWLHYLQSLSLGVKTQAGIDTLRSAQTAFAAGLLTSPAEPAEWLRLAWIHYFLSHPPLDAIQAWKMSVFAGRAQHYLLLDRIILGLRYRAYFMEEDLPLLRDQILLSWEYQRGEMKVALREQTLPLKGLRSLLSLSNPEIIVEMEKVCE